MHQGPHQWHNIDKLGYFQALFKKTKKYVFLGKYELDMVLDIHAHTALTGLFVYGNSYDDVYRSHKNSALFGNILFCILF